MRPVRLQMNGFAAFRDEAVVDFADADFFVLVGATGSGKSTVIDALTFALYGTVPRWNHRSMVMYGLAPTANQGKVALLFDVGDTRYLIARELRRTKTGVHVRNARLERLLDPSATGTIDDATESIATDSGVTPAVEKLLGLPYEHFCQCVVLPQGEFADFLRAKPAERRTILLKLLGAGLYTDIGQRANGRASLAGQRAELLIEQLSGLTDATEAAETSAGQRESDCQALVTAIEQQVPRLRTAATALDAARRERDQLIAERDLLAGLVVPDGIADLDAAHEAARATLDRAAETEAAARRVDRQARDRLAGAPDRAPLERALREHAELATVEATLPPARVQARAAADRLTAAITDAGAATTALERARSARDVARATVAELSTQVDQLTAEVDRLDAVVVPDGLVELAGRTAAAATAVTGAADALAGAQDRETGAQDALAQAPARGPIEESVRLATDLAAAQDGLIPLTADHTRAVAARRAADEAVAEAERAAEQARAAREQARITHRAAALRSELVAGQSCPVCDQPVTTLPAAAHAPELADADEAVRARDRALNRARAAQSTAATAETALATRLAGAREQLAGLTERLAGRPADLEALARTLARIDRLEADARTASTQLRRLRTAHEAAVAAARTLDADTAAARRALRAVRDPLVAFGAPSVDEADLLGAWTALAEWAGQQARARRTHLRAQQAALAAAQTAQARARDDFTAADDAAGAAQRAVNAATAAAERAAATVQHWQDRHAELTAAVADAPGVEAATADLRRIEELTAAVRASDAAVQAAAADRTTASAGLDSLSGRVRQAWRGLRTARDTVIGLGAPDLPEDSLLAGWSALATWATAAARARTAAVPDAEDAVSAATRHRDQAAAQLIGDLAALGLSVDGDLADRAPAAAAAALAQARAERARIAERRARAGAVRAELDQARQDQQVASTLGTLLRSNNFPEWLESAALDTLVIDASRRLGELSGGQFELTHRDGEFMVVDHADADSIRSVRTLSGGETFQASLALALALSTQLSSMAAEGAARLDSIFLDEGFGTLDDATLEVVAGTLENLAQGDRMVGVVTHVGALADRIPVRFVVRRDSRTSSVEREAS